MCGIAGLLGRLDPVERRARLGRAARLLAPRGPDGEGFHEEELLAFAFRRLSIVDLAGGMQPMANEDGAVVSVCNGEIYNFEALRAELVAQGHVFRTRCDAEVLPHLYERDGDAFVERLNGMFALAVWDRRAGRLLLARDRMGEKPLYYRPAAEGLAFASGVRAAASLAGAPLEPDPEALERYLAFLCVPAPRAAVRGFRQLPPGHRLVAEAGRPPGEPQAYWRLPAAEPLRLSRAEAAEQFWTLLVDSVRIRRIGDLPVGVFLSGGIDSSAVALALREVSSGPLRTFTVTFPGAGIHDEAKFARAVAERLGTEHHELPAVPGGAAFQDPCGDLERIAAVHDEPFGDTSAWPTWHLCRRSREAGKVILGGDGGDELLAGYRWTWDHLRLLRRAGSLPRPILSLGRAILGRLVPEPERRGGMLARAARAAWYTGANRLAGYVRKYTCFTPAMRARLRGRAQPAEAGEPLTDEVLSAAGGPRVPDGNDLLAVDLHHYLPSDILTKVDRASMAHGLEVRSPFLDHRLVELAFRIPFDWKLSPGGESKLLLKDRLRGQLPDRILEPRKMGFGFPVDAWLRGPLTGLLDEVLLDPGARWSAHLDGSCVRRWVGEHRSGRQDLGTQLWALLMLEFWLRSI